MGTLLGFVGEAVVDDMNKVDGGGSRCNFRLSRWPQRGERKQQSGNNQPTDNTRCDPFASEWVMFGNKRTSEQDQASQLKKNIEIFLDYQHDCRFDFQLSLPGGKNQQTENTRCDPFASEWVMFGNKRTSEQDPVSQVKKIIKVFGYRQQPCSRQYLM